MNTGFEIDIGLISGWRNIARFIDRSVRTAKRYHYRYGMPIRRWPGGVPVIFPQEIQRWIILFNERMEEMRKLDRK